MSTQLLTNNSNGSSRILPPEFSLPPSPLYLFLAIFDIPRQCRVFFRNLQNNTLLNRISSALSLFGRPLHLSYSIGYIANTILFFLKNTVTWLRTSLPLVGLATSGVELCKEFFDLLQLRKTATKAEALSLQLLGDHKLFADQLEENQPLKQLLGKAVLTEINEAIQKSDIPLIQKRLKEQIKKAKIVHAICLTTIAASIASIATTMVFAPFAVILGIGGLASLTSGLRHALISGYLYQKGHKISFYQMIPKWIRHKVIEVLQYKKTVPSFPTY